MLLETFVSPQTKIHDHVKFSEIFTKQNTRVLPTANHMDWDPKMQT